MTHSINSLVPQNGILRITQLCTFLGLSRSTIYAKLQPTSPYHDPDFPRPIRLSSAPNGAIGWKVDEINAWIESLTRAS